MRLQDRIYKNYANFISEYKDYVKTPKEAEKIFSDPGLFETFRKMLLDGIEDQEQLQVINQVFDRQRKSIIEESSASISQTGNAIGYAIMSFPILTDIYTEDILGKAITTQFVDVPFLTVPKLQLRAQLNNTDGSKETLIIPRPRVLIRCKPETFKFIPNKTHNVYSFSASFPDGVSEKNSVLNRRSFSIVEVTVEINDGTTKDVIIPIDDLRTDARSNINQEISYQDGNYELIIQLTGFVDFDKGQFTFSGVCKQGDPTHTYVVKSVTADVTFVARKGDVGRVKVTVENKGWDIILDPKEDFEFELTAEILQDYSSIYNIKLVQLLSTAIKNQILLNRDHDIATLLRKNEKNMKEFNTYESINMQLYRDEMSIVSSGFISAIFQSIVPRISVINRYIHLNYRATPQYLLTGVRAACMLENLQEYATSLPTMREGLAGFDNLHAMNIHVNVFLKQLILTSPAIPDDKIYFIYKPQDVTELEHTVLGNFVFKPLYTVDEVTDSVRRVYFRTRTAMELFKPEATGCLHILGLEDLLTANTLEPYTKVV